MFYVGISTSSGFASVCLTDLDGNIIKKKNNSNKNSQSKFSAILLQELLKEVNIESIDRIFVDIGPGSFTGIRIGISLGIGFAANDKQINGVSSLEAIAFSCNANQNITVGIPTINGQLYAQVFNKELKPITSPNLVDQNNIQELSKKYSSSLTIESEISAEMVVKTGIYLVKKNISHNIMPIYVAEPRIF